MPRLEVVHRDEDDDEADYLRERGHRDAQEQREHARDGRRGSAPASRAPLIPVAIATTDSPNATTSSSP